MFECPKCHKPLPDRPGQIIFKCPDCGQEWLITEIYKAQERGKRGKK